MESKAKFSLNLITDVEAMSVDSRESYDSLIDSFSLLSMHQSYG